MHAAHDRVTVSHTLRNRVTVGVRCQVPGHGMRVRVVLPGQIRICHRDLM